MTRGATIGPETRLDPAWAPAIRQLFALSWRWRLPLLLVALIGAGLGASLRIAFPGTYFASEQLLFDPQGMKVFDSDAAPTRLDANAQINFVESQMGVLMSERVLSRLLARVCDVKADTPPKRFDKFCYETRADHPPARAFDALHGALSVKRLERSFLVDVTAVADTPEFAAALASGLVDSYIEENAASRAAAAAALGDELKARIQSLRRELSETEKKAETYRRQEDLTSIGDKLLIELKLADAANGLDGAQSRLQIAQARLAQLDATPGDATGLGALGGDSETRPLAELLVRRAAANADLAPLASKLGARNPELIQARSRLGSIDRGISHELASIRAAAHSQLLRAEQERTAFSRAVDRLTTELSRARQSQIALQSLDQSAAASRKLIDNFESRSREVAESGNLDLANLRVASRARPPAPKKLLYGLVAYSLAGFVLSLALSLAGVAALAALAVSYFPNGAPVTADSEAELLRDASRRMRAGAV